jgi:hypothetical protein
MQPDSLSSARLSLAAALTSGRLADFTAQAEAEGIGPADRAQFDALLGRVTAPQPEGQTSRSLARGVSRGK